MTTKNTNNQNNRRRIVFMGTPAFACSVLQQLIDDKYDIAAVVCQPDKRVGREQKIEFPPVKQMALDHNIPVLQPIKMKVEYASVLAFEPEMIVTCAYGQMLPVELLTIPKFGCVNVHASLLPRLRGGAPIHKAILYGEKETGITLMKTAQKMDAGDMYAKLATPITREDTMGSLHDRLMNLGAQIVHEYLPLIFEGKLEPVAQNEEEATFAYNVSKEEEKIDFTKSYEEVHNHVRALIPAPGSYGVIKGKKLKFWQVSDAIASDDEVACGTLVGLTPLGIQVKTANGYVYFLEVQLEGKKTMSAKEFMNGAGRSFVGEKFS